LLAVCLLGADAELRREWGTVGMHTATDRSLAALCGCAGKLKNKYHTHIHTLPHTPPHSTPYPTLSPSLFSCTRPRTGASPRYAAVQLSSRISTTHTYTHSHSHRPTPPPILPSLPLSFHAHGIHTYAYMHIHMYYIYISISLCIYTYTRPLRAQPRLAPGLTR